MSKVKVRVYVYFDVEVESGGSSFHSGVIENALVTVRNSGLSQQNTVAMERVIFGATVLSHETVLLSSDANQVIKVGEGQ